MEKINLNFSSELDQVSYLEGYHRSGWNYVVKNMLKKSGPLGINCDTYVDRTFHWKKPSFLPYTKPWVGFVHHTFDTSFSKYNNVELLKNEYFIESLLNCKGLFVFGKVHEERWLKEFTSMGINVPVYSLIHPTETPRIKFDFQNFQKNNNKKIIQIGAWLRNNYSIYKLNNGKSPLILSDGLELQKCALKGKNMDYYFKPLNFFSKKSPITPPIKTYKSLFSTIVVDFSSKLSANAFPPQGLPIYNDPREETDHHNDDDPREETDHHDDDDPIDGMCRCDGMSRGDGMSRECCVGGGNKYVKGAWDMLREYDDSVSIIPYLDNNHYDDLLSKNIVFIDLVDSAAVNTLIECIVRNTPIIVNKTETVVELLGEGYPLYFSKLNDMLLLTMNDILDAHTYLLQLNKQALSIEYFMSTFESKL
jgi:hypothetical protein